MKTRVAPILCLFGAILVCQLPLAASTASAQEPTDKPRSITTPAKNPKPPKKNRKPFDALRNRKPSSKTPGTAPLAPPEPPKPAATKPTPKTPPRTATPAAPLSPIPGTDIKTFETGIEYRPTSPQTRVTFNLEDADLPDLVRLISQITGKRFILPSKARSLKATVYAPTKVTAAEAYQAFLSILELNGMALVPAGRYLKIVESGRVETRPIPLFTHDETVPRGDRFLTRLHRVSHIAAEDAAKLLERFKSGDGNLTAYAPSNMLIITDTGTNIRRMLRILAIVDVPRTGEQIWVEPVHHANASELAARLTEIFEVSSPSRAKSTPRKAPKGKGKGKGKGKTSTSSGSGSTTVGGGESRLTKIISDERTNSLIIVATESAYLRILEMLKYLDVSMEGEGRIHVHRLQYSDAEEIASTLSALTGKGSARGKGKGKGASGGATAASIFEGKVAITAHASANALVITSSMHDYAAVRHVIDMLDQPRKQVYIEAVIMELEVKRSSSLGFAFHGGVPNFPTDGSTTAFGFDAGRTIGGLSSGELLTGLAVGVQGPSLDTSSSIGLDLPSFGVAIKALAGDSNANVLSTPHLIALDNVEAEISVGGNVPLQSSTGGFGGAGGLGALSGLLGQAGGAGGIPPALLSSLGGLGGAVPRQDVGTTITITPHINESDEIRLEISEEISEAGAPSEFGVGARSINRTKAKTEVVVRDQQTVVIGGLMRDTTSTSSTKVPILGDIPLIGALFRSSTKVKSKKNLLLFLTPYIIRSPADLRAIYERKMRERQEFLDRYFVFQGHDYEPAVDYSRTRGLIGEIFREMVEIDEQRALNAELAARPKLVHVRRPAVGLAPRGTSGDPGTEAGLIIDERGEGVPIPPDLPIDTAPPPPPESDE